MSKGNCAVYQKIFNEFLSKYNKVHSELQEYKKFNSHLLARIIQWERNAVTNYQNKRKETINLYPVPADITENVLKESIYNALSLARVNVIPNSLHAYHRKK